MQYIAVAVAGHMGRSPLTYTAAEQLPAGTPVLVPLRGRSAHGLVLGPAEPLAEGKQALPVAHTAPQLHPAVAALLPQLAAQALAPVGQVVGLLPTALWQLAGYVPQRARGLRLLRADAPAEAARQWPRRKKLQALLQRLADAPGVVFGGAERKQMLDSGLAEETEGGVLPGHTTGEVTSGQCLWLPNASAGGSAEAGIVQVGGIIEQESSTNEAGLAQATESSAASPALPQAGLPWLLIGSKAARVARYRAWAQAATAARPLIIIVPHMQDMLSIAPCLGVQASQLALWHGAMGPAEQAQELWRIIHHAESGVQAIIAQRGALLAAPAGAASLLIIDDEHERYAYKHHYSPTVQTPDIALQLAATTDTPLVLASHAPSLEAFAMAEAGALHREAA